MPVKFSGYKKTPRVFDTLILLGKSLSAGYTYQVYGDRGVGASNGRTPVISPNTDFYHDFLLKGGFEMPGLASLPQVSAPPRPPTTPLPASPVPTPPGR